MLHLITVNVTKRYFMDTETNIHLLQGEKEILNFDKEHEVTVFNESEFDVNIEAVRDLIEPVSYTTTIKPGNRAYWPFFKGKIIAKPSEQGIAQLKTIVSDASHWLSSPISPYPKTIFSPDLTLPSGDQPSLLIE